MGRLWASKWTAKIPNVPARKIRSLAGEPDYKSVNLTWEVESAEQVRRVPAMRGGRGAKKSTAAGPTERGARSFTVFYCELQNWGPHRCRSKTVKDDSEDDQSNGKQYSLLVKNLRMATKYSFHVKPLAGAGAQQRVEEPLAAAGPPEGNEINQGQTIVIPTKGFSAHATQCLPDASEIEVETGPYFGGRIAAENGNCGVQGDARSPQESYMMRIDHEKCGSKVSTRDLTVETYITVQENLGILTHSTRRFVVVCTFQPDTLTVRARLALPGKGGAAPVPTSEWWPANGRNARVRQFNMIGKSGLVLKGVGAADDDDLPVEDEPGVPAVVRELPPVVTESGAVPTTAAERDSNHPMPAIAPTKASERDVKFARLFNGQDQSTDEGVGLIDELDEYEQRHPVPTVDSTAASSQRRSSGGGASGVFDGSGLLITACLAVILVGALVYLLQREFKKQRMIHQHQQMERTASERRAAAVTM
ncbi:uncharacterized protein LOC131208025 [Anopheles bellator]|uniref:uncharacterized protein LOC131208025 n=1 Tax=Anopheles bellator TaxID=139047 RepID=UPI0026482B92|nr:uncharacterized protein LOC131208025 [Anopheles bellator]